MFFLDLDFRLFRFFNSFAGVSPTWDGIFVFLAEYTMFLMLAGLAVFLMLKQREKIRSLIAMKALTAAFMGRVFFVSLIRTFFFRKRPFITATVTQLVNHNALEGAFPSGHATVMFALAFSFLLGENKNFLWGGIYFILALVSSLARIVVGVHFPLDIVGGILMAALSILITEKLFDFWLKKRKKEVPRER